MGFAGGWVSTVGDDVVAVYEVRGEHATILDEMGAGVWHEGAVVVGQSMEAGMALMRDAVENPQHLAVEIGGRTLEKRISALNENYRFYRRGTSELDDAGKLRFRKIQIYVDLLGPAKRLYLTAKDDRSASSVDSLTLDTLSVVEQTLGGPGVIGDLATLVEVTDILRQSGIGLETYAPYRDYQRGVDAVCKNNGIVP